MRFFFDDEEYDEPECDPTPIMADEIITPMPSDETPMVQIVKDKIRQMKSDSLALSKFGFTARLSDYIDPYVNNVGGSLTVGEMRKFAGLE